MDLVKKIYVSDLHLNAIKNEKNENEKKHHEEQERDQQQKVPNMGNMANLAKSFNPSNFKLPSFKSPF